MEQNYEIGQMFFSHKRKAWFKIVDVSFPSKRQEPLYRCVYTVSGEYAQYYESRIENEMEFYPEGRLAPVLYA